METGLTKLQQVLQHSGCCSLLGMTKMNGFLSLSHSFCESSSAILKTKYIWAPKIPFVYVGTWQSPPNQFWWRSITTAISGYAPNHELEEKFLFIICDPSRFPDVGTEIKTQIFFSPQVNFSTSLGGRVLLLPKDTAAHQSI